MDEQITEIVGDRSFSERVLASRRTALVVFGSQGCPLCRFLSSQLPSLASELGPAVDVVSCMVEAGPRTAQRYSVGSIPALFLFSNGGLLASRTGPAPVTEVRRWVMDALAGRDGGRERAPDGFAATFFRHLTSRPVVLRACAVASVVSPVLLLLNHTQLVLSDPASWPVLRKLAMNFIVPYLVSSFSSARAASR